MDHPPGETDTLEGQLPWVDALLKTDATLLKIVLRLVATPGKTATAETATSAAIKAYSIMSWPSVSLPSRRSRCAILAKSFMANYNWLR